MKRRNFLKISSAAGGGLLLSMSLPVSNVFANDNPATFSPNMFLQINKDGSVTYTLTKFEMGQGSSTGLAQIIADELGANWETLKVEIAVYDKKYGNTQATTGGSGSIRRLWKPLREAGATARTVLVEAAAKLCNDKAENFYTKDGYVIHKTKGKKLGFGELIGTAAKLPAPDPKKITLKDSKDFNFIGKALTHRHTQDVVTGKAAYAINVKLPGMLYAVIARSPVHKGKLKGFDASKARQIPGVKDVFAIKPPKLKDPSQAYTQEGVAIVADSTWTAMKARKALRIDWDFEGRDKNNMGALRQQIKQHYTTQDKVVYKKGDANKAFTEADVVLEGIYENPFQAHMMMEPLNAVAYCQANKAEMWVGTQVVGDATQELSQVTGIPLANCKVNVMPAGGGFGRRWNTDYVVEAAMISKKLQAPVKLTWSREDNTQHGAYHPFQHAIHKAAIKGNKIIGWQQKAIHLDHWGSGPGLRDYSFVYNFPNIQTENKQLDEMVLTGAWRSVGEHINGFGRESFIDEVAHQMKKDPLELRLELLNYDLPKPKPNDKRGVSIYNYLGKIKERSIVALKQAKKLGNWGKQMPKGKGQGVAVTNFNRTACAQIAEVTVKNNGEWTVDKIVCVMHLGKVVNPHFVTGQARGGIIWALSALKYGGLDIENGVVQQSNFDTHKVLRMNEIPEIEVHLVESEDDPSGAGEPGVPSLAPAVLNAVFAATGKRIRKMPLLPEDLA